MTRFPFQSFCLCAALSLVLAGAARAQSTDPANLICPRSAPGSVVAPPPDLWSQNGTLEVTFTYQTTVDEQGLTRYCYIANGSLQAPTLHVYPGDTLIIHFQNQLPASLANARPRVSHRRPIAVMQMPMPDFASSPHDSGSDCPGNGIITAATTNLHFHGMNVAPVCGQDDVINTMIQPGDTFTYDVPIPSDEPPGLYWYHPHPHGFSEGQVQGGASGALIVEGIQNVNPSLAGLPQRLFVLRDQLLPNSESNDPNIPAWDVSVNYVPVPYPNYPPAIVQTPVGEQEFWRVVNAAADTIFDLQYTVNGAAQPVQVVAIDGYPVGGGEDGVAQSETETSLLLPPGARAEFVVTTPNLGQQGQLTTQYWNTGPDGDYDPTRPLADIVAQSPSSDSTQTAAARLPSATRRKALTRFAKLQDETPVGQRTLAFSEVLQDPSNPNSPTTFFITVAGQTPAAYTPGQPPNIVVHQGDVEDWTVQNTALEDHIFHIHQLHFQVMAIDGQPVNDPAIRDTIDLPYWSGTGPYPSATLRMDFRDPSIVGTFVYHCHILAHEDGGMMGTIQVLPPGIGTTTALAALSTDVNLNAGVTLTASVTSAAAGAAMTGTVQFLEDGANLGAPVPVANGQAALTTTMSVDGSHAITAFYSGDVNYDESISTALPVTVEDFALSGTSATANAPGQSANATLTVAGTANFTGTINLACSLPATMAEAACFVNPNAVTGSGQATLTVNTTPPHAAGTLPHDRAFPWWNSGRSRKAMAWAAFLLLLLTWWNPWRRRRASVLLGVITVAILSFAVSCGSSGRSDLGTPAGSYTVVVTGTSGSGAAQIQHTAAVPVTIQ